MKNLIILLGLILSFSGYAEKIAIIGGGMAGVASAAFLKNSNHEIHLFEKENRLGGNARTILLPGAGGKKVNVDMGPQYFAKNGWELYIDFLKYFKLYNEKKLLKFNVGFTLFKPNQELPELILPELNGPGLAWLFTKPGSLSRLLTMLTFFQSITKFYQDPQKENITMEEFLKTVSINEEYKEEILLPLMAASFILPMDKIRDVGAIYASGLMQAPGLIPSSEFLVPKLGMQQYIEEIANKLDPGKFKVHLSSPVKKVLKNSQGKIIVMLEDDEELVFDKVILAVHPTVAEKILKDWDTFYNVWEDFVYIPTRVVIHNDLNYLHPVYQSFYNLKVKENGEYYMAMRLGDISPEFGDLIKTWGLNDEEYQDLKERGRILAEEHFEHPFTSPAFIDANKELKRLAKEEGNIYFAGGWIINWETQHTAILSGFEVAKEIDPKASVFWKKKLPFLRKKN